MGPLERIALILPFRATLIPWLCASLWFLYTGAGADFQRAGSIGVAIIFAHFSLAAISVARDSKFIVNSFTKSVFTSLGLSQKIAQMKLEYHDMILYNFQLISHDGGASRRARDSIDEIIEATEGERKNLRKALLGSVGAFENLQERMSSAESLVDSMQNRVSRAQIIPMILATLQWGYGDKFVNLFFQCGGSPC